MTLQLKEKEQEIRINELKLKELKRMSKHNQLAPIKNSSNEHNNSQIPANRSTSAKHNNKDVKEIKQASHKYQSNENLPSKNLKYGKQIQRPEKKKISIKDEQTKEGIEQDIQNKEKLLAELIKLKNETQLDSQPEKTEVIEENSEI